MREWIALLENKHNLKIRKFLLPSEVGPLSQDNPPKGWESKNANGQILFLSYLSSRASDH